MNNASNYQPGDKVTFTNARFSTTGGLRLSVREATVKSVTDSTVTVTYPGGRAPLELPRDRVRPIGQKTEMTEMLENMADSAEASLLGKKA